MKLIYTETLFIYENRYYTLQIAQVKTIFAVLSLRVVFT